MGSYDDEMLFESDLLHNSHQQPLIHPASTVFTPVHDDSHRTPPDVSLGPPSAPSTDAVSDWSVGNLFDNGERPQEVDTPAVGASAAAGSFSTKHHVISEIESVFESMLDVLLHRKASLSLVLKSRTSRKANGSHVGKDICYPGTTAEEAWRFTVLTRILELIHTALINDDVITKREIFYRHPALFLRQSLVDQYVDDIAFTYGVSRSSLNVVAAAKGLVVGALTIQRTNGVQVQTFAGPEAQLVPNIEGVRLETPAKWILVVEKEAIFQSIITSSFWNTFRDEGIMITGKGYPDLATRKLLHRLNSASNHEAPRMPTIYALVDLDPDGLSILSTYKYGSVALAHESHTSIAPDLQWLGIRNTQIISNQSDNLRSIPNSVHQTEGLLRLSSRDRYKARSMLNNGHNSHDIFENEMRRELQIMLMLNMKAEIEILEATNGGLSSWLMEHLGALT